MEKNNRKREKVKAAPRSSNAQIIKEIAASEEILEAIGDGISIQDRNFKIIYENQIHRKIFGDHVGKYCYQVYQKREGVCGGCPVALTFKDGKVHTSHREVHTDKKISYVEITSSPLQDKEGKVIAGIEVVRDITQRKRFNELLKNERDRAQKYFDIAEVIMLVIDVDKKVAHINKKGCHVLGYEKETIIGKDWFNNFLPERIGNDTKQVFIKLINGEVDPVEYYENPVLTKSGEERIIAWHNTILRDEIGNISGTLSSGEDITERKKTERLITDALTFNKTILGTSPIGIVTFKASGQCVSANEAIAKMVGGTVAQLLKQNFRHLESWKRSGMLEVAKNVLATGVEKTMDINVVSTFGKEVWFACRFVPFQFEEQPHLLALFTDISERKRVEEELRKSEQQLRNLTAYVQKVAEIERTNIAREIHDELAQALTVLKMDLTWLKKKLPKGQEPIIERTNTMLKITDKTIQTMKRIATDLRPGVLDDLGLAAAVEWQAEEFQKQTGIKCKVELDAKDITLDRDRNTAIFRIFQETLTNVARHAKATHVSVSLKEKEGQIKLTVKDNGRGITKEEITHPKSYGLMGIRERAKILNGNSIIKGVRGKGTSVTVDLPIHENKKKKNYLLNITP